jgi:ankyrin repeat protein
VELMLELGFDPAAKSIMTDGGTALHAASWQGAVDCVASILRRPAGRALLAVNDPTYHATPLGWCCHGSVNRRNPRGEYPSVARLLIDAGAPLNADVTEREASEEVEAVIDEALRGRRQ